MQKIVVLCTGNSCRSQIAEGYLRNLPGAVRQYIVQGWRLMVLIQELFQ